MTASHLYHRPLGDGTKGNWASTLAWGRTRAIPTDLIQNSYLLESTLRFAVKNYAWTRIENVDRTTELLLGGEPEPAGFVEQPVGRVQAYTFGDDRDFDLLPHIRTARGAQVTAYTPGSRLKPILRLRSCRGCRLSAHPHSWQGATIKSK